MSTHAEIDELLEQAHAAAARDQNKHAALLYERARQLAIQSGQAARSYKIGVWAKRSWSHAGEERRSLTLLLELLHDTPPAADPWDIYEAKDENFWYQVMSKPDPNLDFIVACAHELDSLCSSLGHPRSRDIPYRQSFIFKRQGKWEEALAQCEIMWSRSNETGTDIFNAASGAATIALKLARRDESERWLANITSDNWPASAMSSAAYVRLAIALYDNDSSAAKTTLLALDDSMRGVEHFRYSVQDAEVAVAALGLDEKLGDPLSSAHPGSMRLAEFPVNEFDISHITLYRLSAALYRQIAGLRYAAGMKPVDDFYYRKPHQLLPRGAARLPEEIAARVASARRACDDAMAVAAAIDAAYRSTFRQDDITAMRGRINEIAAAYGLPADQPPEKTTQGTQ